MQLLEFDAANENWLFDVISWFAAKRLQLNATKTEILWFGSETNHRKVLPANRVISVGQSVIQPVTVVRDLGVLIDGELSMRQYVTRLSQTCFFHLRRLWSLRRQLGRDVMARLVSALVLSRLDYCTYRTHSVDIGSVTAGTARRRSSRHGPPTTRPSRCARLALLAGQAEDWV